MWASLIENKYIQISMCTHTVGCCWSFNIYVGTSHSNAKVDPWPWQYGGLLHISAYVKLLLIVYGVYPCQLKTYSFRAPVLKNCGHLWIKTAEKPQDFIIKNSKKNLEERF